MKHQQLVSLGTLALALSYSSASLASSHREAPAISDDPAADNTDLYAWTCDENGTKSLCIVANYIPLELPEGGPNYNKFSDDVLYQLHVTYQDRNGKPNLTDYVTIDVRFKSAPISRVAVDDKAKSPGGGKEFFAQLAGYFTQTADVTMRWNDNRRGEKLFSKVGVAPPNIGQRTATFVYGNPSYEDYAKTFVSEKDGYKFFAGPRDDAFYVNLAQIFDLGSMVGLNTLNDQPFRSRVYDVDPDANGTFADTDPEKAPDGVSGFNTHSIAISIPLRDLAPRGKEAAFNQALADGTPSNLTLFGVWASASRPVVRVLCPPGARGCVDDFGPPVQVSRLGLPLINEAVIGIQDKDKYNRTHPSQDVNNFGAYFLNPILVRDVEAIGGYAQLGVDPVPDSLKYGRVDILNVINLKDIPSAGAHDVTIANGATGDVLRVDVAVPSSFPNGRPLSGEAVKSGKEEDVTDIELSLILTGLTSPVTDYVGGPGDGRELSPEFPYLGTPFAGDAEGKGSPAAF
jgi:hypothetical protein